MKDREIIKYWDKLLGTMGADVGQPEIDKKFVYDTLLSDMIQTTLPMIEWNGLPSSIDTRKFTMYRQLTGYSIFFKKDATLYDSFGGIGGEPDAYYDPTIATISNPYLNYSANLVIGKDCVLDRHDYLLQGLLPWHRLFAEEMAESLLTLRIGLINARAEYIINAEDDNQAEGAKEFLKTLEDGVKLAFLANPSFLQKTMTQTLPYSQTSINTIRSATESIQFLYAKWASGVGLTSSFNSKREYVAIEATTMGEDTIRPKMDLILECAKKTADDLNRLYGLSVTADFSSSWKINQEEAELTIEAMKNEGKEEETKEYGEDKDEESDKPSR